MTKSLVKLLKFAVPIAVIGWLLTTIDPAQVAELRNRPKQWGLLAAGCGLAFGAVSLSFVRWYLLVRVAALNLTIRDAFRLSFIGYLANFISAGNVGGDVFKAVFVAREQPQRRAAAVATVLVDRMIGLYALLLVASLTLLVGNVTSMTAALWTISQLTYGATALGGIGVMLVLIPGFTNGRCTRWISLLPKVGPLSERMIAAVRMYRDRRGVMAAILVLSMLVHALLAISIYLLASGLFGAAPSLVDHLIIVPLSCVAGAVPLTPAGLGSFEIAMDELYRIVPAAGSGLVSGVLIALAYRLATIFIAAIGVVFFWTCPRMDPVNDGNASETSLLGNSAVQEERCTC